MQSDELEQPCDADIQVLAQRQNHKKGLFGGSRENNTLTLTIHRGRNRRRKHNPDFTISRPEKLESVRLSRSRQAGRNDHVSRLAGALDL